MKIRIKTKMNGISIYLNNFYICIKMKNQKYICIKMIYFLKFKINLMLIKIKSTYIKMYIKYSYTSLITKLNIYFIKSNLYFGLIFLFHFIDFESLS